MDFHLLQTTYFKYFYSLLICLIKSTSNLSKKWGHKSHVKNTTLTKRSSGTSYLGCIYCDITKELKIKTIPLQLEEKNLKNVNLSDEIQYYFVFSLRSLSPCLHRCSRLSHETPQAHTFEKGLFYNLYFHIMSLRSYYNVESFPASKLLVVLQIIIILNTYSLKGNMSDSIEVLHRQCHFLKKFCKQPFFFLSWNHKYR